MIHGDKRDQGFRHLIDITRDLASTLDLDILLKHIVHAAAEITGAEAGSILLYDDTARELYFQVATNMDEPTRRGLVVPLEGSIAGWVVTHRKSVRSDNVHEDPRFFQNVEQVTSLPTKSLLGVPLITKDKIIGALEVINKRTGKFTKADEELMEVLGTQAAVAIVNARLFQQSDLIAEFVHELRTPLASIGTATYLLLRPEMSQQQREQMIHNIHGETMRLNSLASAFLDLARLESGRVQYHLTRFELAPVLEECKQIMQTMADGSKILVSLDIPQDFPQIVADRNMLKQVVLNLLSNALKYNQPNGKVSISANFDDKQWGFMIQDTGMGIPESSLAHMFEKFYRVTSNEGKIPGTGLGLSICKQIVTGHGGNISVRSKVGEGTIFSVQMPLKSL